MNKIRPFCVGITTGGEEVDVRKTEEESLKQYGDISDKKALEATVRNELKNIKKATSKEVEKAISSVAKKNTKAAKAVAKVGGASQFVSSLKWFRKGAILGAAIGTGYALSELIHAICKKINDSVIKESQKSKFGEYYHRDIGWY